MSKRLMRAILALAVVSLTVGVALAGAQSSNREFKATLNGANDGTSAKGKGSATFEFSSTGKSIKYTLKATGLTGGVQAAHLHFGKKGKNGDVVVTICGGPCTLPKSGTLTASKFNTKQTKVKSFANVLTDARQGEIYVNIHTKANPAGEIRGQLVRDDAGDDNGNDG
jgi:CHRD domain-containing protein